MGIYQKILAGKVYFPKYFDKNAKALVKKLLTADLSKRYGNLKDGPADILKHLPGDYHHVFDLVHFVLCIQGDRADLGEGFESTSKLHPLASWMSAMMACFAGTASSVLIRSTPTKRLVCSRRFTPLSTTRITTTLT